MDRAPEQVTLLEAARAVARGGALEVKLTALAAQATAAAGASAAVVYLHDSATYRLEPVAQAGLDPQRLAESGPVATNDEREIVARALRDRRLQTVDGDGGSQALESQGHPRAGLVALPIIAADEAGNEDAEGVLLASLGEQRLDSAELTSTLGALADLCAVAIRQARLESALVERADWIGRLATIDPLTGLANRITFDRMLELEIARAARQGTPLSVVLLAVAGQGDELQSRSTDASESVLRHVASTLAEQVRLVDTIARLDTQTFGLIAPGGGGAVVGARVRDAAAAIEAPSGQPIQLAFAVVVYPTEGASSDELLTAAAAALDEVLAGGAEGGVAAGADIDA